MTKYIVSAATLATIATALSALAEDATEVDPNQATLDLSGDQQAIEHFMAEREELLAQIDRSDLCLARVLEERDQARSMLSTRLRQEDGQKADLQRQLNQAIADQREVANAVVQAAQYVEALKYGLGAIGITFEPGEDGLPSIRANPVDLIGFLRANVANA